MITPPHVHRTSDTYTVTAINTGKLALACSSETPSSSVRFDSRSGVGLSHSVFKKLPLLLLSDAESRSAPGVDYRMAPINDVDQKDLFHDVRHSFILSIS